MRTSCAANAEATQLCSNFHILLLHAAAEASKSGRYVVYTIVFYFHSNNFNISSFTFLIFDFDAYVFIRISFT